MSIITNNLQSAIDALNLGDLVAIPTETVYGLAAAATNEDAIKKVFQMKNRPQNHPLILHIAANSDLTYWAKELPDYVPALIKNFWPGPLTLVLKCKTSACSPLIRANQATIAIRCPAHHLAQSLLAKLNFPLVAPSANPFGKISPTTAEHVKESFRNQGLLILDGGRCTLGIESTIIDATNPSGYQILRGGSIDEEQLKQVSPFLLEKKPTTIAVPGNLANHYQPKKPLYCFPSAKELKSFADTHPSTYILAFNKNTVFKEYLGFELPLFPKVYAFELYYQLRIADKSSAKFIAVELPPDRQDWLAIRERVLKASVKN